MTRSSSQQSIDGQSYEYQRDRLSKKLTLAQIEHHARRPMTSTCRASWRSQNASCRAHQTVGPDVARLQAAATSAVLPEGIAYNGNRFNRTAATAPLFKLLGAVREC